MSEYLIFDAGEELLAVAVSSVREVVRAAALSAADANQPDMEGLLNLRGQVVPVISLKRRLSFEQQPLAPSDFLIILADPNDCLYAVRSTGNVRISKDAQPVSEENSTGGRQGSANPLIREGSRFAKLIDPESLPAGEFPSVPMTSQGGET